MGKRDGVMLFAMAALFVAAIVDVNAAKERVKSMNILQKKLKLLNKPAIKTVYSKDGDIIDCIDIHKQPAFDHPALKNHPIQMKPSFEIESKVSTAQNESFRSIPFQVWQRSGSCPEGTIPIRRIRRRDLLRTTSIHHFGKKAFGSINLGSEINRSTAIMLTNGYNYLGASADLNIWNPRVDLPDDFTAAQIWLKNGPADEFDSAEAGWVVRKSQVIWGYKDSIQYLWTADSYKSTGCYDLTCSGFVPTNPKVALGAVVEPLSSTGGDQYTLSVGIFMDSSTSNWWLKVQGMPVGYWPGKLFGYLGHSATLVEWGGEVFSSSLKKTPHTGTGMGSGDYASSLRQYASFVSLPRVMDYSLQLKYPDRVGTWTDEPSCYSSDNYQQTVTTEPVFFFGGPGKSRDCP